MYKQTKKFLATGRTWKKDLEKAVRNIVGCNTIERAIETTKDVIKHYKSQLINQVTDNDYTKITYTNNTLII